jgi:hypothetical protein
MQNMSMNKHLWEKDGIKYVEDPLSTEYFDNWEKFIELKPWEYNSVYCALPVYWCWINIKHEINIGEEHPKEFGITHDRITLVYLEMAPMYPHVFHINVTNRDEKKIKLWLIEHNFIK